MYVNPELTTAMSLASGSSFSDDVKSTNEDGMLLNYNDYLIKSVHERRYSVIMKKLSDDIINQWTGKYHIGHSLTRIPDLKTKGVKMVQQNPLRIRKALKVLSQMIHQMPRILPTQDNEPCNHGKGPMLVIDPGELILLMFSIEVNVQL